MNPDDRNPGDNINPKSSASARAALLEENRERYRALAASHGLPQVLEGPAGREEESSTEAESDEVSNQYDG